mgnify:CR=1 FL=1
MKGNDFVAWVLRSPFHGMLSKDMMLVTVTGRKSGKSISTPTNYVRDGDTLWVISLRERTWWRNLRGGANVRVVLARRGVEGRGQVIEEESQVSQSLFEYYSKVPQYAKYVQVSLDAAGLPVSADCARAAQKLLVVRIDL